MICCTNLSLHVSVNENDFKIKNIEATIYGEIPTLPPPNTKLKTDVA
jgi:2C-methyl-D-erythritol 2,4-cyclodiphosphate synthase